MCKIGTGIIDYRQGTRYLALYPEEGTPVSRGGGGTPYMKGVGMLVVSLRSVNFGFWSLLGCSGQNNIIFSRKGLF